MLLLRPFMMWFVPDLPSMEEREVNFLARKAGHFVQFFILALLIWRAARLAPPLPLTRRRLATLIILLSAGFACMSEGIQLFFTVRSASWGDVLLDTAGAVAAVAVVVLLDFVNSRGPRAG